MTQTNYVEILSPQDAVTGTVDTVLGAGVEAVETLRRPRRSVGRARRRGESVREAAVADVRALPERLIHLYVRQLRRQARRDDVLGLAARTVLEAVNAPAANAAAFFARLEKETELPARAPRSTAGRAAARRAKGAAHTVAGRTRGVAAAARGRRTAPAAPKATKGTGRGRGRRTTTATGTARGLRVAAAR